MRTTPFSRQLHSCVVAWCDYLFRCFLYEVYDSGLIYALSVEVTKCLGFEKWVFYLWNRCTFSCMADESALSDDAALLLWVKERKCIDCWRKLHYWAWEHSLPIFAFSLRLCRQFLKLEKSCAFFHRLRFTQNRVYILGLLLVNPILDSNAILRVWYYI